ncbi:hypothetical protein UY3_02378 [Chelonia mydas]|uniref:Uncharacterized protein n=1 Tax=Chelonia mydas TaxID=8469 RepID=M7CHJ8_CHEMY|nr:hypothetical protein UY3_02378 [Chelonia mydas]
MGCGSSSKVEMVQPSVKELLNGWEAKTQSEALEKPLKKPPAKLEKLKIEKKEVNALTMKDIKNSAEERSEVWPIAAPTGRGSLCLAPPWPGGATGGQWEPRSAEPPDAASKQTGPVRQGLSLNKWQTGFENHWSRVRRRTVCDSMLRLL